MRLKTLRLALCVAGTTFFAQKIKYLKEEIKKMEAYLFNEGFNTPSLKKHPSLHSKTVLRTKGSVIKLKQKKGGSTI